MDVILLQIDLWHNSVVLHSTTQRHLCIFRFPFPRSYHVTSFFLSICFKGLEEVVNRKYIIFGINITGKGLVCLRMKILQIRSLHALIYDKRLLSKRSSTRYKNMCAQTTILH